MSRKKIHPRVKLLIQNSIASRHRSLFFILGEKSKHQVVYLYHLLVKYQIGVESKKPTVIWFFKKDLGFNIYHEKRLKSLKKKYAGNAIFDKEDLFDYFLLSSNLQFCHYSETEKILGQTFGLLIIQDFQGLTPNILARIVECVEGGGVIIFLFSNITSLEGLFPLNMDVHSRYVTEAFPEVIPRFNKRFVLSLASCPNCLVLDDSLHIKLIPRDFDILNQEIPQIKMEHKIVKPILKPSSSDKLNSILSLCCTSDQSHALMKLDDALNNHSVVSVVSLTSGRGRGKSSVLGLALSLALTSSYTKVCITAPQLENLQTLFTFLVKGLIALNYVEGTDYRIFRTESKPMNLISGISVFLENVRTITYLVPVDFHELKIADLVVLDEAAAIPLPLVKQWIGSCTVFMSSTINGYEGTGRSLSLKLINQLSSQCTPQVTKTNAHSALNHKSRVLHEIQLNEAIRYSNGDRVEGWLNQLLCLEACIDMPMLNPPQPQLCELYYVNMDVLFGYNKAAEKFLQQMVSLFVSSHYKNSPNDLMMMADAPAHHVYCLLPPMNPDTKELPIILCAIQVSLEGKISKENISTEYSHGRRASGDLIPWIISQQFQDNEFAALAGARVIRIATHPDYQRMGYGQHAINLLSSFYSSHSKLNDKDKENKTEGSPLVLLTHLKDVPCVPLDYLGVSFGLTTELFRFWKKCGFIPFYIRQTTSEITGEHSCIMIKGFKLKNQWLKKSFCDFTERFLSLLASPFKDFDASLVLEILHVKDMQQSKDLPPGVSQWFFSTRSLERIKAFCLHQVDYHLILDLLPALSRLYFLGSLDGISLPQNQENVLVCMGLQNKSVEVTLSEGRGEHQEVMGWLRKAVQKIFKKICSSTAYHIEANGSETNIKGTQNPSEKKNSFFSTFHQNNCKRNHNHISSNVKKSRITTYD